MAIDTAACSWYDTVVPCHVLVLAGAQRAKGKTNSLQNLTHNKTCSACKTGGQGNNKLVWGNCGEPFAKKMKMTTSAPLSLPKDIINSTQGVKSGFMRMVHAVGEGRTLCQGVTLLCWIHHAANCLPG